MLIAGQRCLPLAANDAYRWPPTMLTAGRQRCLPLAANDAYHWPPTMLTTGRQRCLPLANNACHWPPTMLTAGQRCLPLANLHMFVNPRNNESRVASETLAAGLWRPLATRWPRWANSKCVGELAATDGQARRKSGARGLATSAQSARRACACVSRYVRCAGPQAFTVLCAGP